MPSWFCLAALVGFIVGLPLFIWTEWSYATAPGWLAEWGCIVSFGLASIAAIASLVRRERWRAGSSFLLGAMLALTLASPFVTISTFRSIAQSFSVSSSPQAK
jgi:hypothetical protein